MRKNYTILFFILVLANVSFAQKFIAQTSKSQVAVGETFQISFTLNTSGSNFKVPNLKDFDVYSGPNQSTNMSFVNGSMSQTITLSYLLAPKKEGKVILGPASVTVEGKVIQSNSLTIDVLAGNPANANKSNSQPGAATAPTTENTADNLFIKSSVSKTKVVQGEQISITYKVYTRYQLRGFQDIKFPDYNGFYSQDVPVNNQQVQVSNENIDGINYQVAELKHSFIFPQRSGKLEIQPMEAEIVVRKRSSRQPRDIFEQFFGGGYEDAVYSVKSKAISIDVQPLPSDNKPTSFNGAIGDFTCKIQLNKDKIKANEAVNLKITLTGKGNIKLVEAPVVAFPEDFETYDPKINENIAVTGAGVSGTKTFDYLLIPRHEGDYKIDQISFSYFDASKKEYITIPSPELLIHVDKGDENANSANVFTPSSKNDVKVIGNDIHYIKTNNIILKPKNDYFFGSVLFYSGFAVPLLGFVALLFFRKKYINENQDVVAVKSRKATKMAKKRLTMAEKHLKQNAKELFYAELSQALYGYISDRLNIVGADLNKENIHAILIRKNVSAETVSTLITTLDNCEYARYAPSAVSGELSTIYNNTVRLITTIEDEIK